MYLHADLKMELMESQIPCICMDMQNEATQLTQNTLTNWCPSSFPAPRQWLPVRGEKKMFIVFKAKMLTATIYYL